MKNQIFSVYDSKAGFFGIPVFFRSKGEAVRAFTDLSCDEKTEVGKHPEDFTLFHLAEFDSETGKFIENATPVSMGVAIEFLRKREPAVAVPAAPLNGSEKTVLEVPK